MHGLTCNFFTFAPPAVRKLLVRSQEDLRRFGSHPTPNIMYQCFPEMLPDPELLEYFVSFDKSGELSNDGTELLLNTRERTNREGWLAIICFNPND